MRKKSILLFALVFALLCSACKTDSAPQGVKEQLEEEMFNRHKVSDEVAGDGGNVEVVLRSLHYDGFSTASAQEIVALFDYREPFGPSGDRAQLIALYDASTMKLLAETKYGLDGGGGMGVYFLPRTEEGTRILILMGAVSQGIGWTRAVLLAAGNETWEEHPLTEGDALDRGNDNLYLVTEHMDKKVLLTVLDNAEAGAHPFNLLEYEKNFSDVAASLVWSATDGAFVPLTEESLFD